MKPVSLLLSLGLFAALALPVPAQNDAGTPPLSPNMTVPLPQTLKLPPGSPQARLTTNKPAYKSGQPVRITFRIVNMSGKPVTYDFGTGQRYDITVSGSDGTPIWNWAHGRLFTQNMSVVSLAPGKPLVYTAVWNGRDLSGRPAAPGAYTLDAHLTSNNRPAITGGVIVNTDPDPTNMGLPTRTPAESGSIRQVAPAAQVSAKTTVVIK